MTTPTHAKLSTGYNPVATDTRLYAVDDPDIAEDRWRMANMALSIADTIARRKHANAQKNPDSLQGHDFLVDIGTLKSKDDDKIRILAHTPEYKRLLEICEDMNQHVQFAFNRDFKDPDGRSITILADVRRPFEQSGYKDVLRTYLGFTEDKMAIRQMAVTLSHTVRERESINAGKVQVSDEDKFIRLSGLSASTFEDMAHLMKTPEYKALVDAAKKADKYMDLLRLEDKGKVTVYVGVDTDREFRPSPAYKEIVQAQLSTPAKVPGKTN